MKHQRVSYTKSNGTNDPACITVYKKKNGKGKTKDMHLIEIVRVKFTDK